MNETCPKCGAKQTQRQGGGSTVMPYRRYACGTVLWDNGRLEESEGCLRNQLAQAKERHESLLEACEKLIDMNMLFATHADFSLWTLADVARSVVLADEAKTAMIKARQKGKTP